MREKSAHRLLFIPVDAFFNIILMVLNSKFITFAHSLMIPYCEFIFLPTHLRRMCWLFSAAQEIVSEYVSWSLQQASRILYYSYSAIVIRCKNMKIYHSIIPNENWVKGIFITRRFLIFYVVIYIQNRVKFDFFASRSFLIWV